MIGRGLVAQKMKMMRGKDEGFVSYFHRLDRMLTYALKKRLGLA